MTEAYWSYKDPGATLDYSIDWTAWLKVGDSMASSTWSGQDGITLGTSSLDGSIATIWLSGGTPGSSYKITNRVQSSGGRVDERTIVINVEQR